MVATVETFIAALEVADRGRTSMFKCLNVAMPVIASSQVVYPSPAILNGVINVYEKCTQSCNVHVQSIRSGSLEWKITPRSNSDDHDSLTS